MDSQVFTCFYRNSEEDIGFFAGIKRLAGRVLEQHPLVILLALVGEMQGNLLPGGNPPFRGCIAVFAQHNTDHGAGPTGSSTAGRDTETMDAEDKNPAHPIILQDFRNYI